MSQIIRWGIAGCGLIAQKFADALATVNNAKLVAVASQTPGKAEDFAKLYKVSNFYDSYEQLCANPEVDIIYIANTHNFHKDTAVLCLQHNKAVLCEKPFTLNYKEAEEVVNLSRKKKLFLMEAMWTRFHPSILKLKQLIADNVIGDIKLLKVDFGIETKHGTDGRHLNPKLAGGALLDIGIYPITFAHIVLGEFPENMKSTAIIGNTGVDELSSYIFKYKTGKLAVLTAAVTTFIPHVAVIYGTHGTITVPDFFHSQELIIQNTKGSEKLEFPFICNGYEYEAVEATNCLLNGKTESETMPLNLTLDIMKLMDTLRSDWNMFYPGEK